MKVLLVKDVPNLGRTGEIKEVADGYARNFLLPKGLVTAASGAALNQVQQQKASAQRREAKALSDAQALAVRLGETEVHFKAKVGGQHRLYGSITSSDIADELTRQLGKPVDKHNI